MADFTCSFPGCDRHPSKGDTILRISAKGKGMPFIGRCREHYGPDGDALADADELAASQAIDAGLGSDEPIKSVPPTPTDQAGRAD